MFSLNHSLIHLFLHSLKYHVPPYFQILVTFLSLSIINQYDVISPPPIIITLDMSSCHTSAMLISPKTCRILRRNPFFFSKSAKFRCILAPLVPKFTVSASLGSVLVSGNVIAAAASAGSGSLHGAVSSAITQVAVTAVAIASGACLSTKVDFLWPKVDEQPGTKSFAFASVLILYLWFK